MKTVRILSFTFIIALMLGACSQTANESETNTNSGNQAIEATAQAVLTIDGMVCEMGCANTIQEALASLNGVESCKVDFEAKEAVVDYDPQIVNDNQIIGAITSIHGGTYTVTKVEVKETKTVKSAETVTQTNNSKLQNVFEEPKVNVPSGMFTFRFPNIFDVIVRLI